MSSDQLSRGLREARGSMSQLAAAKAATAAGWKGGYTQPAIAKYESGKLVPSPEQVDRLCQLYGAQPATRRQLMALAEDLRPKVRRVVLSRDYASVQKRIGRIQRASAAVRGFTSTIPPGLFQTRAFVTVLFDGSPGGEVRLQEQEQLDDQSRTFSYVLTEGALGGTVLDPEEAAAQLEHIADLTRRPNIRIGIVPWGRRLPVVPVNTWESYDERAVIAGTATGNATITDAEDVRHYLKVWHALADPAVSVYDDEARALLRACAARYRRLLHGASD